MKRSSTSEVISAMKIKWQWNTTTHQLEWQKSRKLMALNAGKDVKQHELSFYLVKMKNTHTHTHTQSMARLEDNLLISNKTKHTLTIQLSHPTPWYLPKRVENSCLHNNLQMDADSSFIHNCWNMEATKMSFIRWMDKLWYIQTM